MLGPVIDPSEWKDRPMNDFSRIHRICSYLAMFPPNLANYFINRFSQKGDLVVDPFCGRGTTPLEAYLLERNAVGSDLNPLAVRLSRGKLNAPTGIDGMVKVIKRVQELEDKFTITKTQYSEQAKKIRRRSEKPPGVGVVFGKNVLEQLLFLQKELISSSTHNPVDPFLISIILGAMHGSSDSYFSVSMPNTFSMSPKYIKKYVNENKLKYPNRNVFAILRERAAVALYSAEEIQNTFAEIHEHNAEQFDTIDFKKPAKLLFSSPPYLKVIKYGQYNWIRLWFLGEDYKQVDEDLSDDLALEDYLDFMENVISSSRKVLDQNGLACWVIGDVEKGANKINLAEKVWERISESDDWELHCVDEAPLGIIVDEIAPSKKVTRIWNSGGHEIWHKSQDIATEKCILHVNTQSEADLKVKELNELNEYVRDEYFSQPMGTSGQATPLDRILMIKRVGAKVFDSRLDVSYKKSDKSPSSTNQNLFVSTPYLEWLMGQEPTKYKRYMRRLTKFDIVRVIFDKLNLEITEDDKSTGSTIKASILRKLWYEICHCKDTVIPKTKHKILEDVLAKLEMEFNKKTDTSTSSTITKIGVFKILIGIQ
jgi:hypothetical protein